MSDKHSILIIKLIKTHFIQHVSENLSRKNLIIVPWYEYFYEEEDFMATYKKKAIKITLDIDKLV